MLKHLALPQLLRRLLRQQLPKLRQAPRQNSHLRVLNKSLRLGRLAKKLLTR